MYEKKLEYLKGLMAGLPVDASTNEGKLFAAVIDVLDAMCESLSDAEEDITELEDALDELDDDLDEFVGMMEALDDDDDEDEDDDEDGEYEITCPGCEHVFVVNEEAIFKGKVNCPSCGEKMTFEIGGCDCGHCRDHDHEEH